MLRSIQFTAACRTGLEQLNRVYRSEPALHLLDNNPAGFEWVDCNDNLTSTISLLRKSESPKDTVLIVCNFTPIPRVGYRVGVPEGGYWRELLNSDALEYGGTGSGQPRRSSCRGRTSPRPPALAEAYVAAAGGTVSEESLDTTRAPSGLCFSTQIRSMSVMATFRQSNWLGIRIESP